MAHPQRTVAATLAVRVPVNAAGSLVDGTVRVVERIDTVERVDAPEIRGIEPGLNDTTVVVGVHVTFDAGDRRNEVGDRGEDLAVVRRALESGVGIAAVDELEEIDGAPVPINR